jgi:hypothetical protein
VLYFEDDYVLEVELTIHIYVDKWPMTEPPSSLPIVVTTPQRQGKTPAFTHHCVTPIHPFCGPPITPIASTTPLNRSRSHGHHESSNEQIRDRQHGRRPKTFARSILRPTQTIERLQGQTSEEAAFSKEGTE